MPNRHLVEFKSAGKRVRCAWRRSRAAAAARVVESLECRRLLSAAFSPALDYAAGANPDFVASGDFNGDGKTDLVVSSYNDHGLNVVLGNGDGSFAAPAPIALTDAPDFVTTGDVNNDGKLDLITASFNNNTVSVLLGNGDGTFAPETDYAAGTGPRAVVLGDFNGDNKPDIAVAKSYDKSLTILTNNGDGTFAAPSTMSLSFAPTDLVVGDFNGDGKLDLAAADFFNDRVAILSGNGNGTFQSPIFQSTGQGPTSIAAGDFNGDGKLDLATANYYDGMLSVLAGKGDGSLQSATTLTCGSGATFVAAADIDLDGQVDLVGVNANADTVTLFSGKGDGTFLLGSTYSTGDSPRSLVLARLNANNVLDAAVANQGASTVSVLIGAAVTPPTANAGGPYYVNEGGTVQLNGLGSSGPNLSYVWDLDGDGIYGESGAPAKRGNEVGATPIFSAASIDGPDTRTVWLKVTAGNGLIAISSATIYILNVPPALVISGNSSATAGASYTLHLSSSDPGADTISSWLISWGDGTTQTVNGNPASVAKTYMAAGSFTIGASATDEDGTYNANSIGVTVWSEVTRPTAVLASAPNVLSGAAGYTYSIAYSDNIALNMASIDLNDILITGPNGFSRLSHVVSITSSNAASAVVTYLLDAPGGSWDPADNGTYTIALRASQIADMAGNFASPVKLGTFQVGLLPPDSAGNLMSRARSLGAIGAGVTRNCGDGVGAADRNDYYKFSIRSALTFNAKIYNLTDNADLMLLNAAGNRIAYSKNAATAADGFTRSLAAGTYYLRVLYNGAVGTTFRLRIQTTGLAASAAPASGIDAARNLGTLSAGAVRIAEGSVSPTGGPVYTRFNLTNTADVYLKLTALDGSAALDLLDGRGRLIQHATAGGVRSRLTAGTYYARLTPVGGAAAAYRLRVALA